MENRLGFVPRPARRAVRLPARRVLPRLAPGGRQQERQERLLRFFWGRLQMAEQPVDILIIEGLLASPIFDDGG